MLSLSLDRGGLILWCFCFSHLPFPLLQGQSIFGMKSGARHFEQVHSALLLLGHSFWKSEKKPLLLV